MNGNGGTLLHRLLPDRPPTPVGAADEVLPPETMGEKMRAWWRGNGWGAAEPMPTSGYMTLVPLSDARLRPRRTKLLVGSLGALGAALMLLVFVLVPRGLSVAETCVQSDAMSWNTTKHTYQLKLLATIKVANPNYVQAALRGDLRIKFYDTLAGFARIRDVVVPARANPFVFTVKVDASNVPSNYTLTILSECAAFPRRLIFFQRLKLQAETLMQRQSLSAVDSYFLIDCVQGGTVPPAPDQPLAPAPVGTRRLMATPAAPAAPAA